MANQKLHGKQGAIYFGGAKDAGGVLVTQKSEWTLQRNRDYVDATVFGEANKTYLAGLPNVQGNFSGLLDLDGDLLLNAATSEAQQIYLYAETDLLGGTAIDRLIAHGPGLVDANVTCSNTDAVRITGEFRANGSWTIDL